MTFCLASGHAAITTPDKEKEKSDQIAHPKVSMMFGSDLSTPQKPHALQGQGELKKKLVLNDCFFVLFCFLQLCKNMTLLFQGVISSMLSMHLSMQAGHLESTRKMEELLLRAILLLFNTVI